MKKKRIAKEKKDGNILRHEVTRYTYHFDNHTVQFSGKEY